MTEHDVIDQAEVVDALAHPDPDPERLPALLDPALIQQEQTAAHLLRASLRIHDDIERMQAKMDAEVAAWAAEIGKLQAKRDQWRALVKDWMLRTGVTQIKCPWFTASTTKPRTKLVIESEDECLVVLKGLQGGEAAIRVKETILKTELEPIYNAIPSAFGKAVRIEEGEPGLTIRRK